MSYQKCPICEGKGEIDLSKYREISGGRTIRIGCINIIPCGVCNGEKIINETNGMPPSRQPIQEKKEKVSEAIKEQVNPNTDQ